MDVGLSYSRDFCSSVCDWHVGRAVWDSGITTFVSVFQFLVFEIHSFSVEF